MTKVQHQDSQSTTTPDAPASRTEMLTKISDRLDGLDQLVSNELSKYQSARLSDDCVNTRHPAQYVLSVVIPVYNEMRTITRVVSRVAALPLDKEIVIVDDCSTDGTVGLLKKFEGIEGIKIIFKDVNQGKGAALRTGFENTCGRVVVVQDADLEYDPCEIPGLIEPILRGESEIVYGSRFIGNVQHDKSFVHRFGNGLLTKLSNLFSGLHLTDMETCYKAFHSDVLNCIDVDQDRFGIEPELTAKLARRGYRFSEVPISYNPRGYADGKKIGIRDLFKAFYCIGRYGISD